MKPASPFGLTARLRRTLYRGHRHLEAGNLSDSERAGQRVVTQLPFEGQVGGASTQELLVGGLELLALVRRELADFSGAVRLHQSALTVLDSDPGQSGQPVRDHWSTGDEQRMRCIIHLRLGENHRLLARYADAEHHHRLALAIAQSLQREDPALVAWSRNGLGIVFKDTHRFPEADEAYREALNSAEAALGPSCPDLAPIHHNLAGLAHTQGRYADAEPHIRRALQLSRQRGTGSSALAADLAVLGAILLGQQRPVEAEGALGQALDLWERRFGPDHYEVAVVVQNLAAVYDARGDDDRASEAYLRALKIKLSILGPDHPETRVLQRLVRARARSAAAAELQKPAPRS